MSLKFNDSFTEFIKRSGSESLTSAQVTSEHSLYVSGALNVYIETEEEWLLHSFTTLFSFLVVVADLIFRCPTLLLLSLGVKSKR